MTRRTEIGLGLVAILGLMIIWVWTHAHGELGPLVPVSDVGQTPEQAAANQYLCDCAPLNSFGSACEGLTWDYDFMFGPIDRRTAIPAKCNAGNLAVDYVTNNGTFPYA